MDKPVTMGRMISSDTLGLSLHQAAKKGNKRALKKRLKTGIAVDYPNDEGQSALFCACCDNKECSAQVLLKFGANPNERSNCGMTPVHMACHNCNIKLLLMLIEAGGDLRLHDYDGRTPRDWAVLNNDPKKRFKMVEFLEKSQVFAMTHTGKEIAANDAGNSSGRIPSLIQMLRKRVGADQNVHLDPLKRVQSMGFGSVYTGGEAQGAVVSVIPVVSENALYHDSQGVTYENGSFLVMESMTWNHTPVTVKRLHKHSHPGGYVDTLISEMEQMGKIHHPNVLLMMGVCQTGSLDTVILVFERIGLGSLYYYLHQRLERLPTQNIRDILAQICSALMFLHDQNNIHCSLSSHAISLVTPFCAKLGNFEHMLSSSKADMGKHSSVAQIKYQNTLYNWMAPELMQDQPATFLCDVYSYCSILWEMFECEIPWDLCDAELIKHKLIVEKQQLRIESTRMPALFKSIIGMGLQLNPYNRNADFNKIHLWLQGHPDQAIADIQADPSPSKPARKSYPGSEAEARPSAPPTETEEYSPDSKPKRRQVRRDSYPGLEKNYNQHSPQESKRTNRVKIVSSDPQRYKEDTGSTQGRVPFLSGNSEWQCNYDRSKDATTYSYTARVQKSPVQKKYIRKELESSDSDGDDTPLKKFVVDRTPKKYIDHSGTYDPVSVSPKGSTSPVPLGTSKFSYLALGQQSTGKQQHAVVKPASHCTEAGCAKTCGQLTTAGSLYALYNSGTELHELAKQAIGIPATNQYGTFPRSKRAQQYYEDYDQEPDDVHFKPVNHNEADPEWYGGKGSVRNLVSLYQEQADEHDFQQKVLDGKVNYHDHTLNNSIKKEQRKKSPVVKGLEYQEFVKLCNNPPMYNQSSLKYGDPNYNCDRRYDPRGGFDDIEVLESSSYSSDASSHTCCNSDSGQSSSVDSDLLSSWIADQIEKARADVVRDKALAYEACQGEGGLLDEIMNEISNSEKKRGNTKYLGSRNNQGRIRSQQEFDLKDYYIDDDISTENEGKSHIKLHGNSHYMERKKPNMRSKSDIKPHKDEPAFRKEKKIKINSGPRAVAKQTTSGIFKDKAAAKGFTTTVTVESSLTHPGQHHLRHTATDLATGTTKMLHEETVKATTVRSTLEA